MYQDDKDAEYLDRDDRVFDEKLERIGGVFVEPQHSEVDCNREEDACAPDDYPEDPYAIDNRPGTEDDIGYSFGLQTRDANDLTLVPDTQTHQTGRPAADTERDLELGTADEQDLWKSQEALVEEDVEDGLKLPMGMTEEDGERVMDAMGDDEGDGAPEDIAGTSAIGEPTATEDRGGFPERKD